MKTEWRRDWNICVGVLQAFSGGVAIEKVMPAPGPVRVDAVTVEPPGPVID